MMLFPQLQTQGTSVTTMSSTESNTGTCSCSKILLSTDTRLETLDKVRLAYMSTARGWLNKS